jgi:hypothetical protein
MEKTMTNKAGKFTTLAVAAALSSMFASSAFAQDTIGVSVGANAGVTAAANAGATASVSGVGGLINSLLTDVGSVLGGVGLGGIL